ncbi:MAG: hypothetical protein SFV23_19560 [Planctomycetaceae bacterium]|nr:hypothetical protein [Planctomycetaceae bacterium]
MNRWTVTLVRTLAVYAAASIQLTILPEPGPQLLLAVAVWILCESSPRGGILWAMAIGLLLDAAGHGRLGLHVATCGVLAATAHATILTSDRPAFWHGPVIAGWLAWGDSMISQILQRSLAQDAMELVAVTLHAVAIAGLTAAVVLAGVIFRELTRRCFMLREYPSVVRLENQWSRLTEA